jgi:hypothetical protein
MGLFEDALDGAGVEAAVLLGARGGAEEGLLAVVAYPFTGWTMPAAAREPGGRAGQPRRPG